MEQNPTPRDLKACREDRLLRVTWPDREDAIPFVFLRGECQCARCVNEWTGEPLLDPASISPEITIERMELVGHYAFRVHWSDGHQSGLYTWERLRALTGAK